MFLLKLFYDFSKIIYEILESNKNIVLINKKFKAYKIVNKNTMVYNAKTFEIYHKLTKTGEIAYRKMLEKEADKILFKHEHPVKWFL